MSSKKVLSIRPLSLIAVLQLLINLFKRPSKDIMPALLMINYRFPPSHFVSCKRLGHLFLEAKSVFADVHVITSKQNNNYPSDSLLQFQVSNKHLIDHRDFRAKLHLKSNNENRWIENMKRSYLGQKVLELRKRWPLFYYFGDGGKDYISKAIKEAENIINKHQITHIFTSYGPYADVVIGHKLKKSHPNLIWIADFRDLFENKPWEGLKKGYPFWHLKKKIRNADYITTVSKGLAEKFSSIHPNVNVLYNGIGELTQHPQNSIVDSDFKICYTGSLYNRWNALDIFLKAYKEVLKDYTNAKDTINILLKYFGPDNNQFRQKAELFDLKEATSSKKSIPMKATLRIQKESHINLLLTWSHQKQKGILNAKLFEYLGAGKPIFAVVDGPLDEELKYWVEDVGNGKCVFSQEHSAAEVAKILKGLIDQLTAGKWEPPKSLPDKMYWSVQGAEFWQKTIRTQASKRTL